MLVGIVLFSLIDEFMKKGMSKRDASAKALRIVERMIR